MADLRASQSCESESKGDAHCPAWLKENDHFKIHNSQVPAIYSWEKPSELLFIKEREGSLAKKERKGSSLWECAGDFQAKQMRNLAFFACIKSVV